MGTRKSMPETFDILKDFLGEVVHLSVVLGPQVRRHVDVRDTARPGPGGMQERAAGAADLVDDFFGQDLAALRVIGHFIPVDLDEPCPAAADADDIIPFVDGPDRDRADGRVETGDIASAGEDADDPSLGLDVGHSLSPYIRRSIPAVKGLQSAGDSPRPRYTLPAVSLFSRLKKSAMNLWRSRAIRRPSAVNIRPLILLSFTKNSR